MKFYRFIITLIFISSIIYFFFDIFKKPEIERYPLSRITGEAGYECTENEDYCIGITTKCKYPIKNGWFGAEKICPQSTPKKK